MSGPPTAEADRGVSRGALLGSLPAGLRTAAPLELDNSTPLALSEGAVWLVLSGEVDVFAVPTDASGRIGRRVYIASTRAGALLVGAADAEVGGRTWRLQAVGVRASAQPLPPDWIDAAEGTPVLRAGLFGWISDMTSGITADGPRLAVAADQQPLDLAPGQVLASPGGLTWLTPRGEGLQLGGRAVAAGTSLPLADRWAVAVSTATTAIAADTAAPADALAGIALVQRSLLLIHADLAAHRASLEQQREERREQMDAAARASALSRLQAIDSDSISAPTDPDPLLAACLLLGSLTGIDVRRPANWSGRSSGDPVHAIARASGFRIRQVSLGPHWWRGAIEPMLAFSDTGAPVVLAPSPGGGYEAIDPATGERRRPDAAPDLRPSAYVFYHPLPGGSLNVRGLLRFGVRGGGADVRRMLWFSVIAGLLSLAIPVATGAILGSLVPEGEQGSVMTASAVLLLVVFATTGFLLARSGALLRLQGRMLANMQTGLWDRLIALPAQFFTRFSVADLTLRVNGVDAIQQIVAAVASQTLLALVTLVFSLALLFIYSPSLALMVVGITAVAVICSAMLTWAQIRRLRAMYDAKGRASGTLLQIVQGIDKVRASAAETRALGAWSLHFAPQAANLLSSERLSAVRTALYAALPAVLTFVVFAEVAADPTAISTSAFLAFITALGQITAATSQLDLNLGYALNIVPLFDRMRPVLAEAEEVPPGATDPGRLSGRLELAGVNYRYPGMDSLVLQDINIRVEPGEFVAVVGPSGSGKSTLVRLLLGFDHPEAGAVTYDRKDLRTLDVRGVRSQIGVALQNAPVTGTDIFAAIVGGWRLTEEQAWAAAEQVGLADDIRAMPMGMHTILGDNAATFSGGQRQRLVLAGAIAREPRLVILDEATSALDSVTQALVADSFAKLRVSRIVVAHRLSTIRGADRVIVLDKGRVVQEGGFDELASQPGIFAAMVARQSL